MDLQEGMKSTIKSKYTNKYDKTKNYREELKVVQSFHEKNYRNYPKTQPKNEELYIFLTKLKRIVTVKMSTIPKLNY